MHPVFTVCLLGALVSCTGLERELLSQELTSLFLGRAVHRRLPVCQWEQAVSGSALRVEQQLSALARKVVPATTNITENLRVTVSHHRCSSGAVQMGSGSNKETEVSSNKKKLDADLKRIEAREAAENQRARVTRADQ